MIKTYNEFNVLNKKCPYDKYTKIMVGSISCHNCKHNRNEVKTNAEWVTTFNINCDMESKK